MLLRRPIAVKLPAQLKGFADDVDMMGATIEAYVRVLTGEVVAMGRGGTLVDWSDSEGRAYLSFYTAENILNWESHTAAQISTLFLISRVPD